MTTLTDKLIHLSLDAINHGPRRYAPDPNADYQVDQFKAQCDRDQQYRAFNASDLRRISARPVAMKRCVGCAMCMTAAFIECEDERGAWCADCANA